MKLETEGSDRTVFDDGATDMLQGKHGRDWFFADLDGEHDDDDNVKNLATNERLDLIDELP